MGLVCLSTQLHCPIPGLIPVLSSQVESHSTGLLLFHPFLTAAAAAAASSNGFSYSISHALCEQLIPTVAIKKTLKKVLLRAFDSTN